jgi:hypothetical protein
MDYRIKQRLTQSYPQHHQGNPPPYRPNQGLNPNSVNSQPNRKQRHIPQQSNNTYSAPPSYRQEPHVNPK